jgi:hypothetical protein
MKNKMKTLNILSLMTMVAMLCITLSSCRKLQGNVNPYLGEWKVSLLIENYNEQGNKISEVIKTDPNTIVISEDEVKINAHPMKLNTLITEFEPIGYVKTQGNGGVFFSPDITNDRINFWYYGWTSAVSQTATIISRSKNKIVLGAVILDANNLNSTTLNTMKAMQTLTLTR